MPEMFPRGGSISSRNHREEVLVVLSLLHQVSFFVLSPQLKAILRPPHATWTSVDLDVHGNYASTRKHTTVLMDSEAGLWPL